MAFGPKVEGALAFAEDPASGVSLVTIQGAHTLDSAIAVLGPIADLTALTTIQYPEVEVGDNARRQRRSTPDHLLVQARLASGGALSMEVAGGRPPEATPFSLTVTGEQGDLVLEGGAPRGFQSGRLSLSLRGERQSVDEGETGALPDTAANVAGVYAALRDDIRQGISTVPGFAHAIRLARLVDDVLSSARAGTRKRAVDWPQR